MSLERLGLLPLTLLDYPGEVAATLFTYGCNLRCPYCHNANLVEGGIPEDFLLREEVLAFLDKRKNLLSGVCITGGEPLLHPDLRQLLLEIRGRGYKIKLDTNGGFPERLGPLLEEGIVDYVAMDVKMAPERYREIGGSEKEEQKIRESIEILGRYMGSPKIEFRTTVVPGLFDEEDLKRIVALLPAGARYSLGAFRGGETLDPAYRSVASPALERLEAMKAIADAAGLECSVRAAGAALV
ncbi:MAG: anaerobic ribonucleoside-triphosphate reductase activating protein [Spirochaetaceae bacterium]